MTAATITPMTKLHQDLRAWVASANPGAARVKVTRRRGSGCIEGALIKPDTLGFYAAVYVVVSTAPDGRCCHVGLWGVFGHSRVLRFATRTEVGNALPLITAYAFDAAAQLHACRHGGVALPDRVGYVTVGSRVYENIAGGRR